jgi:hypothetical protein
MNWSRPRRECPCSLFGSLRVQVSTGRSAIVPEDFVVSLSHSSGQMPKKYLRLRLDHFFPHPLQFSVHYHCATRRYRGNTRDVPGATEERHASLRQDSRFLARDINPRPSEYEAGCYPFAKSRSCRLPHGCPRFATPESRYRCNCIDD